MTAVKRNRLVTGRIVGTHRACHYYHTRFVRFFDSQSVINCKMQRTNVETVSRFGGNPSLVHSHQFFDQVDKFLSVKVRHGESHRRLLESSCVTVSSEYPDLSFLVFICFKSFVALDAVVETGDERVEEEVMERF